MPASFSFSLLSLTSPAAAPTGLQPAADSGATAGRDLRLDPSTGDLELLEGDLVLVAGAEGIASDLGSRLQTFAGEWFLDTSIGVPYLTEILGQKPSPQRLEEVFRAAILETPGVTGVQTFAATQAGRELSIRFAVSTDLGAVIEAALSLEA